MIFSALPRTSIKYRKFIDYSFNCINPFGLKPNLPRRAAQKQIYMDT